MPPKKSVLGPDVTKQRKFKPPLLAPPPPPPPSPPAAAASSDDETTGSQEPSQSQQGEDEIATLSKILESMMQASKDRRARRRTEIEDAYEVDFEASEKKARQWIQLVAAREKRRQLMVLKRLKSLLEKKRAVENDIITALEALNNACGDLGDTLKAVITNHGEAGRDEPN
ncbi:uncharacterized protein H6S33_005039 [Morchella sextelata]|uniref:uncharacterized protein n=1 Tax=Morchella sextelata TaxID=1174677 RepID=UPI001D048CBE|nr:uncharacterized protein H6S33_005039 [Morchella sextelata]KAH0605057.1 hypothetical protein H6S33_005039 [Morchella sextelata]